MRTMATSGISMAGRKLNFADILPAMRDQPGFLDMQRVQGVGMLAQCALTFTSAERAVTCVPSTDGLWIGPGISARSPTAIAKNNITHFVAANGDSSPASFHKLPTLVVDVEDHPEEDILAHLPSAVAFIQAAVDASGSVLVYCTAGISRSATIVIAYIMSCQRCSVPTALSALTASRPFVKPNPGFMDQLLAFEDQLCYGGVRLARCELCLRRRVTRELDGSHPAFVIIECETCELPMAVLRSHSCGLSEVDPRSVEEMASRLLAVAARLRPNHTHWIDKIQRTIPDHVHWHARCWPKPNL